MMKLIACLALLSLIFALLSSGLIVSTVSKAPTEHPVLEQLDTDSSPLASQWVWEVWAKRLCTSHHRWGKRRWLQRLCCWLRRWSKRRLRRRLVRQQRRALLEGTPAGEPSTEEVPSPTANQAEGSTAIAPVFGLATSAARVAPGPVEGRAQ